VSRSRAIFAAAIFIFCSSNAVAFAQTKPVSKENQTRSKAFFDQAETYYKLSRFQDALDAYRKAYEYYPVAAFLFNIAQCYRNLGDTERSIFTFKVYLRDAKSATARLRVKKLIEELENESSKSSFATPAVPIGGDEVPKLESEVPAPVISSPVLTTNSTDSSERPPAFYQRWWFWTAVVVAGAAVGGGIYWSQENESMSEIMPGTLGAGIVKWN